MGYAGASRFASESRSALTRDSASVSDRLGNAGSDVLSKNCCKKMKTLGHAGKMGAAGVLLCGACCALPLLPFIGAGMAATLGFWFEKVGLVLALVSAISFAVYWLRNPRKKADSV